MSTVSIQSLPSAVFVNALSFLGKPEHITSCSVSKEWRRLASDNLVWKKAAEQECHGQTPKTPNFKGFLSKCASQKLKSNQEILDRIQTFVNRVSLGQNARFTCFIHSGARHKNITLEIKATKDKITDPDSWSLCQGDLHFKEDYVAVNDIGDGSLQTPQPPEQRLGCCRFSLYARTTDATTATNSERLIRHLVTDTFGYVLRFPAIPGVHPGDFQRRICGVVGRKMTDLEMHRYQEYLMTATHVVVALSAYFVNLYVNSAST